MKRLLSVKVVREVQAGASPLDENHASTEIFAIHAIFQARLFICISNQYVNKIVFVVNIGRVHSGVPRGFFQRKRPFGDRRFSLRQHKRADAMTCQRPVHSAENTTVSALSFCHAMLLYCHIMGWHVACQLLQRGACTHNDVATRHLQARFRVE
ncbi:hypothetical protein [Janthinobacterium sp. ROICE36]|uniref:hypothetical protein n=1 Tax=Janthinobacterium sp. ROICE36 TaxID=2048670 RepID=UPI0011AEE90B|nr:hypothetical protein [Janthinobacterium sp. ROICE36]